MKKLVGRVGDGSALSFVWLCFFWCMRGLSVLWSFNWKSNGSGQIEDLGPYQAICNAKKKERQALIASVYPWPPDSS
jgi:hypothetical protein